MASHDVDVAYITSPTSIAYLSGLSANPHERLMSLSVRDDGATLVVPALERDNADQRVRGIEVLSWRDGDDPYACVGQALAGSRRIAIEEEHLTVSRARAMRERAGVELVGDVGVEVRRLRLIKDSDEVKKLQRAAEINDAVIEVVFGRLAIGQSELEVALAIGTAVSAAEATLAFDTSVQVGANSALPHHAPGERRIQQGDLVLVDFGAAFDGYRADTTRVVVAGEPSRRQLEIHELVLEAHDAAIAAVRPGASTATIDKAARDVISAAGLGDRFFHRVGHGLGLEIHEDPSLDPGSQTVLEPGMVFTIEPGVYISDWGGIRIEDDVVVDENGCRLLTKADRSLRQV